MSNSHRSLGTILCAALGTLLACAPRATTARNPADIAVYGVRGANGVIRITTTRPGWR